MKVIHKTKKQLLTDLLILVFVSGIVGIALKFTVFFDKWVYYPWFPNVLDSVFLVCGVVWLAWMVKRKR
jgi:cytochrome c oxidase assembly factor CtaG